MSETQQVQNSTGSIPSSDKTEGYFGDCLRFRSVEPRPTPNSKAFSVMLTELSSAMGWLQL
ncbi:hypothetical protein Bca4012_008660 [Brassica carinata]